MQRAIKALIFISFTIMLSACVDVGEHIIVNDDGSGAIAVVTRFDPALNDQDIEDFDTLLTGVRYRQERQTLDGHQVNVETAAFISFDDITLDTGSYKPIPRGVLRTFDKNVLSPDELALLSKSLRDKFYIVSIELPSRIAGIQPAVINGITYKAIIKGNVATWNLPLPQLIKHINTDKLTFGALH